MTFTEFNGPDILSSLGRLIVLARLEQHKIGYAFFFLDPLINLAGHAGDVLHSKSSLNLASAEGTGYCPTDSASVNSTIKSISRGINGSWADTQFIYFSSAWFPAAAHYFPTVLLRNHKSSLY